MKRSASTSLEAASLPFPLFCFSNSQSPVFPLLLLLQGRRKHLIFIILVFLLRQLPQVFLFLLLLMEFTIQKLFLVPLFILNQFPLRLPLTLLVLIVYYESLKRLNLLLIQSICLNPQPALHLFHLFLF